MERVKLADVARAAGVHPGTASRALNPSPTDRVSLATSQRVAQAAERLGYVPNNHARGLRTARSYVVGMVVPDITNSLFPPMVRGAESVLSAAGYTLVLTDTDNDAGTERRQIDLLRARGTDGFIVATARWKDETLDAVAEANIPTVLINRYVASRRLPYVGSDERTGIRLAVDHLVALGHRQVVHLAGPQDTSTGRERAAAFRQAVRAEDLPGNRARIRVCTGYTEAAGAEATRRLLASGEEFTAVVAGNDLIALGVLAVFAQAGIRCPEHVSVVGFNDIPFVDKLTPPLTTIRLPLREMGTLAAKILLTALDGTPGDAQLAQSLLGVELVVRGTTAVAPPAT